MSWPSTTSSTPSTSPLPSLSSSTEPLLMQGEALVSYYLNHHPTDFYPPPLLPSSLTPVQNPYTTHQATPNPTALHQGEMGTSSHSPSHLLHAHLPPTFSTSQLEASDTKGEERGRRGDVLVKEEPMEGEDEEEDGEDGEEGEEEDEEEDGEEVVEQDGKQVNPLYHSAPPIFMMQTPPSSLPSSLSITTTTTVNGSAPSLLLSSLPSSSPQDPLFRSPLPQSHHIQPWMQPSDPAQWQQV
jgi:hypothetical protein